MKWKQIGGYGQIGDMNWGFDESRIEAEKWLGECKKHIGKIILLTGGGSLPGTFFLALLSDAWMSQLGDTPVPQVKLTNVTPPVAGRSTEFEPYLGSWQISVLEEEF